MVRTHFISVISRFANFRFLRSRLLLWIALPLTLAAIALLSSQTPLGGGSLITSAKPIQWIEFEGQLNKIRIGETEALEYLERCLAHPQDSRQHAFEPGVFYYLTIRRVGWRGLYKSYAVVPHSGRGFFIALTNFQSNWGLEDAVMVYVPFTDPIPKKVTQLMSFLLKRSD